MIRRANGSGKAGRSCLSQQLQAVQSLIEAISGTALTWSNMPAALTELNVLPVLSPQRRNVGNFIAAEYGYFIVRCTTAGAANAELAVQYSTDSGANWTTFQDFSSTDIWLPLDANTDTAAVFPIPSAARIRDLWLRVVGRNGDGTTDPSFTVSVGAVNGPRSLVAGVTDWRGDLSASWRSSLTNKKPLWRGRSTTSFSGTWTNMPNALTVVPNPPMPSNNPISSGFNIFIGAHAGWIRHVTNVGVAGAAAAVLLLQYSTNSGGAWQFIDSTFGNTGAPIAINAVGLSFSSFVRIDEAVFSANPANLQMRLVGQGGDGALDPSFILWAVETAVIDPTTY